MGIPWSRKRRDADPDAGGADESRGQRQALIFAVAGLVLLIAAYVAVLLLSRPAAPGSELRYDSFIADSRAHRIQDATVLVADRRIVGTYDAGQYWVSYGEGIAGNTVFGRMAGELEAAHVPVTIDQQWYKGLIGPLTILMPTLILVLALVIVVLLTRSQGAALQGFGRLRSKRVPRGDGRITFADVAGVDEAVEELVEIRDYLTSPARFLAMGARVPSGILLVGPPGCGKTLLARAVAGEAEVPFFSMSGSDFVEIFVGVGAARIRDLFRQARQAAPAIIFIDELDAVGRVRNANIAGGQDEREVGRHFRLAVHVVMPSHGRVRDAGQGLF